MTTLRKSLLILFAVFISGSIYPQTAGSPDTLLNDPEFAHASLSICFRDISDGAIVNSYNSDMALGSASIMKLVTTAAALEILGPDFRFNTRLGYTGKIDSQGTLKGYIIIKGGGDPTLGSERFSEFYGDFISLWSDIIVSTGIKKIEGRVISDATIFDYFPSPGGWSWSDLGNYYGAGAYGLSLFDNMYRIHLKTGGPGSVPVITLMVPEIPGLIVKNLLTAEGDEDKGYVYLEPYGNFAEIRGTVPVDREDFVLKASIPDPPGFAASLLDAKLRESGMDISDPCTSLRLFDISSSDAGNSSAVVISKIDSPPLSEIIKVTNTESVNLFAEQILKIIAAEEEGNTEATSSDGIDIVSIKLDSAGIDTGGLYMTDGSGLSRYDAVSSGFITELLYYMKSRSRYSGEFVSSLPVPGKEGTLKYYFKDDIFNGRLKAKSGTSTRIRNYAGYISTLSGKEYSFAILVNNFDCDPSEVTHRIEKILKEFIENN